MVMVKDCYKATEIPLEDVSGEVCWVKIETDDNPLYVGSFYRTPSDWQILKSASRTWEIFVKYQLN